MPGRNNELARRRMDGERKSRIRKKKDRVEKTDKSPRRKGKKMSMSRYRRCFHSRLLLKVSLGWQH